MSGTPSKQPRGGAGGVEKQVNVQVAVRCRPPNDKERGEPHFNIVQCDEDAAQISTPGTQGVVRKGASATGQKTYGFDVVFGQTSTQKQVYDALCAPIVDEVMEGFNCTVFAYGQTGTGKTHTMEGSRVLDGEYPHRDERNAGLLPRAVQHIFIKLYRSGVEEYSVRISHLELYNEHITDLLVCGTEDPEKLRIYDDEKTGTFVSGLTEVTVESEEEVMQILERSAKKRITAETEMNKFSSRSHSIFSITIHSKTASASDGEEVLRVGKLNLVDLAGSENIGRSGAVHQRAREAGNINQSLLALGKVINALVEHHPYVPYRDSKLTRLLQESLGGKNKTCIIATIGPSVASLDETISTLEYAFRAKSIRNRPMLNSIMTKKELLSDFTRKMARLERELVAAREKNGVYLPVDQFHQMKTRMNVMEENNNFLKQTVQDKDDCLTKTTQELNETIRELHNTQRNLRVTETNLDHTKKALTHTNSQLKQTQVQVEEQKHVIQAHQNTETKLTDEAQTLRRTLDETLDHLYKLHTKLDQTMANEASNADAICAFQNTVTTSRETLDEKIQTLFTQQEAALARLGGLTVDQSRILNDHHATLSKTSSALQKSIQSTTEELQSDRDRLGAQLEANIGIFAEKLDRKTKEVSRAQESVFESTRDTSKAVQHAADSFHREVTDAKVRHAKNIALQNKSLQEFNKAHGEEQAKLIHDVEESSMSRTAQMDESMERMESELDAMLQRIQSSKKERMSSLTNLLNSYVEETKKSGEDQLRHVREEFLALEGSANVLSSEVRSAVQAAQTGLVHLSTTSSELQSAVREANDGMVVQVFAPMAEVKKEVVETLRGGVDKHRVETERAMVETESQLKDLVVFESATSEVLEGTYRDMMDELSKQRTVVSDRTSTVLSNMRSDIESVLDNVREKITEIGEQSDQVAANVHSSCEQVAERVTLFTDVAFQVDNKASRPVSANEQWTDLAPDENSFMTTAAVKAIDRVVQSAIVSAPLSERN